MYFYWLCMLVYYNLICTYVSVHVCVCLPHAIYSHEFMAKKFFCFQFHMIQLSTHSIDMTLVTKYITKEDNVFTVHLTQLRVSAGLY